MYVSIIFSICFGLFFQIGFPHDLPWKPYNLQLPSGCSRSFQSGTFNIKLCSFLLQVPRARLRQSLTKLGLADDKRLQHGHKWYKMCLGPLRAKHQALLASRSVSAPNPKVPSVRSPCPLSLTILTFLATSSLAQWLKENIPGAPGCLACSRDPALANGLQARVMGAASGKSSKPLFAFTPHQASVGQVWGPCLSLWPPHPDTQSAWFGEPPLQDGGAQKVEIGFLRT